MPSRIEGYPLPGAPVEEFENPTTTVPGIAIGATKDGQYNFVTITVMDEDDQPIGYTIAMPLSMARALGRGLLKQSNDLAKESRRSGYSDN